MTAVAYTLSAADNSAAVFWEFLYPFPRAVYCGPGTHSFPEYGAERQKTIVFRRGLLSLSIED